MNLTSRYAPPPGGGNRATSGTSPLLITSWEGGATRLSHDDQMAWWAWLIAEVGVSAVIVVGDVSLLMLFFTRKLLGQSTNILVFSVAVADLITGLLVLPLDVLQRALSETSGYMCKSYFYLSNVSKTAMIYTVTMLAMERIVAALGANFRILSPGRCLFFSSLTWFFAAAYHIWSVVLYDTRLVSSHSPAPASVHSQDQGNHRPDHHQQHEDFHQKLRQQLEQAAGSGDPRDGPVSDVQNPAHHEAVLAWTTSTSYSSSNHSTHMCFSSTRFQRLVDVFLVLDLFVTFLLPVLGSAVLFAVFWRKRHSVRAPGRPYRSSTSVIIFTFALLVCFVCCHLPLEVAALHVQRSRVGQRDLLAYKVCQLASFTRGFWDVFIFGAFRHYVCRKERALAVFRGSRYGPEGRGGTVSGGGGGGGGVEMRGIGGDGGDGGGGVHAGGGDREAVASPTMCLAVPSRGRAPSVSLLDSDQEVTVTPHRSSASDH